MEFAKPLDSQFESSYTPIPFDALLQMASMRKQEHDAAMKEANTFIRANKAFHSRSQKDVERYAELGVKPIEEFVKKLNTDPNYLKSGDFQADINNRINNVDYGALSMLQRNKELLDKAYEAADPRWSALGDDTVERLNSWDTLNQGLYDTKQLEYVDPSEEASKHGDVLLKNNKKLIERTKDGFMVFGTTMDDLVNGVANSGYAEEMLQNPSIRKRFELTTGTTNPEVLLNSVRKFIIDTNLPKVGESGREADPYAVERYKSRLRQGEERAKNGEKNGEKIGYSKQLELSAGFDFKKDPNGKVVVQPLIDKTLDQLNENLLASNHAMVPSQKLLNSNPVLKSTYDEVNKFGKPYLYGAYFNTDNSKFSSAIPSKEILQETFERNAWNSYSTAYIKALKGNKNTMTVAGDVYIPTKSSGGVLPTKAILESQLSGFRENGMDFSNTNKNVTKYYSTITDPTERKLVNEVNNGKINSLVKYEDQYTTMVGRDGVTRFYSKTTQLIPGYEIESYLTDDIDRPTKVYTAKSRLEGIYGKGNVKVVDTTKLTDEELLELGYKRKQGTKYVDVYPEARDIKAKGVSSGTANKVFIVTGVKEFAGINEREVADQAIRKATTTAKSADEITQ